MEPIKNLARALRRHHTDRLKKNRRNYHGYGYSGWRAPWRMTPTQLGKVVTTAANCSCWMCGNPRRYFTDDHPLGLTYQEVVQRAYAESFLDDERA